MYGHEPENADHCLCLFLIRLDNLLLRSTRFLRFPHPRRRQAANWPPMFTPPSLASTEWSSGGLPGTRAAATYHVLLFLVVGCACARAPASWSWRRRAARGGAGDLLRLLLRQYVEESFGARPERSRRCPSSAPATVRLRELQSATRPWLKWCRQKEGTGGE